MLKAKSQLNRFLKWVKVYMLYFLLSGGEDDHIILFVNSCTEHLLL